MNSGDNVRIYPRHSSLVFFLRSFQFKLIHFQLKYALLCVDFVPRIDLLTLNIQHCILNGSFETVATK